MPGPIPSILPVFSLWLYAILCDLCNYCHITYLVIAGVFHWNFNRQNSLVLSLVFRFNAVWRWNKSSESQERLITPPGALVHHGSHVEFLGWPRSKRPSARTGWGSIAWYSAHRAIERRRHTGSVHSCIFYSCSSFFSTEYISDNDAITVYCQIRTSTDSVPLSSVAVSKLTSFIMILIN